MTNRKTMKEPNRERKQEIKYHVNLNDEQKEARRLIIENQIVIVTGRAGSGKSLVCALSALDFLNKKQCDHIYITRATIEVGNSLGYLPGSLEDKFNPYLEAFQENLVKCADKVKIQNMVKDEKIVAYPVQFIRGKTIDDILVVEEAQNLSKAEMLAILTRLGKTGKIIVNGDNEQQDTKDATTGLTYAIELSKKIDGIKWIKLKENHRSDLVGQILNYEYNK
jgi:phosphate starvation-inducible protein PhoH and related proteins